MHKLIITLGLCMLFIQIQAQEDTPTGIRIVDVAGTKLPQSRY